MSADLLEAFGLDLQTNDERLNHENARSAGPAAQSNLVSEVEDTWRPWPSHPPNYPVPLQRPAQGLWEQHEQGNDVLFDAESHEVGTLTQPGNDEDDFGDFEQADAGATTAPGGRALQSFETQSTNFLDLKGIGTAALQDTFKAAPNTRSQLPRPGPTTQSKALLPTEHAYPQAASLLAADDGWGRFGDVAELKPISGDNNQNSIPIRSLPQLSTTGRKDFKSMKTAQQRLVPMLPTKSNQANEDDDGFGDGWGDFEDWSSGVSAEAKSRIQAEAQYSPKPAVKVPEVSRERPTNIPPPAFLLALLPEVFSSLVARTHQRGMEERTGKMTLEAYRVCARVVAGRHLRWKRDTVLAQSMKIGAAGRSGGMKLTSLDKGESRKEDQETEEAVASWSRSSHRLNAAMTKAKVIRPPVALSTNLVVRTATGADVLTANHVCPICGLKRNERVNGIDINVSDTFGEFWVEHWGHKDCYEFWYQYSNILDQR